MKYSFIIKGLFCCFIFINSSSARVYDLPENGSKVIGEPKIYIAQQGDYFQSIAEQFNIGFLALLAANPGIDPFLPGVGESINIPNQFILPYVKREGIVVNLPELRLYYFPKNMNTVYVFPVGVGREGLKTPRVISFISDKRKDPIWRPTVETRARYFKEHGKEMVKEVLPGPANPFGKYALRIGHSEYLIHGTNKRFGIGVRSSSGCIRMYDADIKWLYENINVNTPVSIIDQPIKMAYEPLNQRYIEIHTPMSDMDKNLKIESMAKAQAFIGKKDRDKKRFDELMANSDGSVNKI